MSISTPTRLSKHTTTQINTSHHCHELTFIPGFTVLVVDTNILLSSLSSIASLVESEQWTVVVPLPVIMELDGLSGGGQGGIGNMKTNRNVATMPTTSATVHLVEAAQTALAYLTSHLCTTPSRSKSRLHMTTTCPLSVSGLNKWILEASEVMSVLVGRRA
jgi:protein SMG6